MNNSADYGVVTVPYKANNQVNDEELAKRIREAYCPGMQGMAVCSEKGEFLTYISLDQVKTMMGKCFGEGVLFQGPYGIVLTPFLNNGKIDYEELGRQLENACKTSITGLVVCGSTGEFTYLSMDEMKEIMAFSKKVIAGRKEFICGATSPSTHHTLELLRYIEELGADGALVAPPFYFPLSDSDVLDFYTAIATAPGSLPIVAYQIPQCTSGISMSVFQELLKLPRIKGLKNSSGNCLQIMQQIDLRNEFRKDFAVLTGSDESIYALVNCGANGSFTAIGYLYPELVANVYRHLKDEEGLYYQHIVVKLATLAGKITYPLGYRMLGEASGKMNFGKYLQAVSEERMRGYEAVKRQMQEVLREYETVLADEENESMKAAVADERKECMKAAVWTDYGKIEVKEVPMPIIGDDEVLLKVRAAGVCMTDLHVYTGKFAYGRPPHILGHEICGEVAEMGKNVVGFEKGQRVVLETTIGCGQCMFCRTGRGNLCEQRTEIGMAPHNGGYAQYVKAPAKNLFVVPDEVSDEEAAIMESINCPAGALIRRGVRFGETVVVFGVGPAGLAFIQTAKALGAGKVIAVARNRKRLERTLQFGADAIVCSSEENVAERIRELNAGEAPGLICEATGVPSIIEEACEIVQNSGRIILCGLPNEEGEISYPVKNIIMKQLEVYGAMENPQSWAPLLKLVAAGRINLKDMVTHTFLLDNITDAFAMLEDKKEYPIKIVVYPWA